MELKDFNIFNLSLQQKKLLKKKIGSGGEQVNDGLAVFRVADTGTSIIFELLSGVPKIDENNQFLAQFVSPHQFCLVKAYEYSLNIVFFDGEYFSSYNAVYIDVSKLKNAKVGDIIEYSLSDFDYTYYPILNTIYLVSDPNTQRDKSFPAYVFRISINEFANSCIKFIYVSNSSNQYKVEEYGTIKKIDYINNFLYISIMDQVWKYSFTVDGNDCKDFTFVEVVQP